MIHPLLIGTYTQKLPHVNGHARGLVAAVFDGEGLIEVVDEVAPLVNPSWVTVSAEGTTVYAVEEVGPEGSVVAFERAEAGLRPLGSVPAGGDSPAHVVVHPSGRFLLTGTYGSGTVSVWSLDEEGIPGERTGFLQHAGSGPDPVRQDAPHVHQLLVDAVSGEVVVVDLGLGEVRWYELSPEGELASAPNATVSVGAAGPRHVVFHPLGRHAFLVNELDSTLAVLTRGADDRFTVTGTVSTRAPGADGANFPAAVRVTDDGATVFVTNRGDDTIAVFAFDAATGAATLVSFAAAGGHSPRDLVISPSGDRVLVACQDSDLVTVFAFDEETWSLTQLSATSVPTPVCLALLSSREDS